MTDMPSLVQRSPTGVGHGRHSTVHHRSRALQKMVTSSPAGTGARYGRAGVTITGRDETIANPLDSGRTMGNGSRRRLVGEPIAGPRPKCGDGHSPVSHRMESSGMDNAHAPRWGAPQRIMPADFWDWSIPVPLSQGWRCGPFVFVGGQISADGHGRTIGVGDIEVQTRNVFNNVRTVLNEAGADMRQLVKFNTYYVFEGEGEGDEIREYWEKMTAVAHPLTV